MSRPVLFTEKLQAALSKIGSANGTKLPTLNDPKSQGHVDMALGKLIRSFGEDMLERGKAALAEQVQELRAKGKGTHSTTLAYGVLIAQNTDQRGSLDQTLVINKLVKQGICKDMASAQAWVDECCKAPTTRCTLSAAVNFDALQQMTEA